VFPYLATAVWSSDIREKQHKPPGTIPKKDISEAKLKNYQVSGDLGRSLPGANPVRLLYVHFQRQRCIRLERFFKVDEFFFSHSRS
jgi:hypothetical protein